MITFETEVFSRFNDKWALLAAGSIDDHNAMTIGWGGLGTLWARPVVTVYVKQIRHTKKYMDSCDYFTVSFYDEKYKEALGIMGTVSGKDADKDKASGLTQKDLGCCVTYEEAETTLLCKKIYFDDLKAENIPAEIMEQMYSKDDPHRMYIGEVVEIL